MSDRLDPCRTCGKSFPASGFYATERNKSGHHSDCKRLHGAFAALNFPRPGEASARRRDDAVKPEEGNRLDRPDIPSLIAALMASGITQRAIAATLRVSKDAVNRWATGKSHPRERVAVRLLALARDRGVR